MLISLICIASVYAVKVSLFNTKIALNTQTKLITEQAATTALDDAISRIQANLSEWNNAEIIQQNKQLTYNVTSQQQRIARESYAISTFILTSRAVANEDAATAEQHQHLVGLPLLAKIPAAPLMVKGELNGGYRISIVTNPNGGGDNLPISVWTPVAIADLPALPTTCLMYEFKAHQCDQQWLSKAGFKSADIVDSSLTFPTDLLAYLTPIKTTDWTSLQDEATAILTTCDTLNERSNGLIWIQGDCALPMGLELGSFASPVILVIQQGKLVMPSPSSVKGLLILLNPDENHSPPEIANFGQSTLTGALISTGGLDMTKGKLQIIFDADVLGNLQNHPDLSRLARVPGSWRDF
jgi:hypothetical protein